MQLSDFATLELAKEYPSTQGRMLSPNLVVSMLTESGSVLLLQEAAKTDDKAAGFLLALSGAVTEYDLVTSESLDSIGMKQQALLTYLVAAEAVTPEFKSMAILMANPVTQPFKNATQAEFDEAKDTGETILLVQNNKQHEYKINTTNQPLKPTDIVIEHRFGTDAENLTDWIEIGRIRNVYYPTTMTGSPYKSGQVAASYANVRELRLVSPLTLGVSIV